jgi:DNA repair protein SbcD/Mre11
LKVLHLSDLHLETSFAAAGLPPSVGARYRADLRATLERIMGLARERQVDAVTIAGDLYEQNYALPDTASFLAQQFASLSPVRVFIAPGESDPYTNDSLYALTRWPENVFIFPRGRLSSTELAPGVMLWGTAHPIGRGHSLIERFTPDNEAVNLLLLHTGDAGHSNPSESPFSVDLAALFVAGLDLALLGSRHESYISPPDAPYAIYPGSPEPLGIEASGGAHQIVLMTIQDRVCTPELIPINTWRHVALRVNLEEAETTVDEAAARVRQALEAVQCIEDERAICHVTLTGSNEPNVEALRGLVETKAHLRFEAQTPPARDWERLSQEPTVRGLLVSRLRERLDSATNAEEKILAMNALSLALLAFDGKEVQPSEID